MEKRKRYRCGAITLGSQCVVSDPCYNENDTHCYKVLSNVKCGVWKSVIPIIENERGFGRVSKLVLRHEENNERIQPNEYIGSVCVDSGTCGISELDYFKETRNDEKWYVQNVCNGFYMKKSQSNNVEQKYIFCCSGYGDGIYPVYVKRSNEGEITCITIDFMI